MIIYFGVFFSMEMIVESGLNVRIELRQLYTMELSAERIRVKEIEEGKEEKEFDKIDFNFMRQMLILNCAGYVCGLVTLLLEIIKFTVLH